jgi:hypothetical protein
VTDSAAYSTSTITPPELPGWNFRHLQRSLATKN